MKNLNKKDLEIPVGGYIEMVDFLGSNVNVDPRTVPNAAFFSGTGGFAVYDDNTGEFIKGFTRNGGNMDLALLEAIYFAEENGIDSTVRSSLPHLQEQAERFRSIVRSDLYDE